MKDKKGFSLIELVIILILLGILISANRVLFSVPAKHIIESEQCINTIHGKVTNFLYEANTGKKKIISGDIGYINQTEEYSITYKFGNPNYGIKLGYNIISGGIIEHIIQEELLLGSGNNNNNINGCQSARHRVMLSGGIQNNGNIYPTQININNNISIENVNRKTYICPRNYNSNDCLNNNKIFENHIDYMICKKDTQICTLYASHHIDTRSQNIFLRRCLSFPLDQECQKRSY